MDAGYLPRHLNRFWLESFGPLDGRLRALFYFGLLCLALQGDYRSPLHVPEVLAEIPAGLLEPQGLGALIPIKWMTPRCLKLVRAICVIAWLLTAVGLFLRTSAVVTALSFAFLHASTTAVAGTSHRWYLPLYCLFLLIGAGPDRWTLDVAWRGVRRRHDRSLEALIRSAILVLAVYILWVAGVSKLRACGMAWADGQTLAYFVTRHQGGAWPRFGIWLVKYAWFAEALSIGVLLFELGAPLAVMGPLPRRIVVAVACSFHVGIATVLAPRYWAHMLCYLLIVGTPRPSRGNSSSTLSLRVWIVSGLTGALVFAGAMRVEAWPFTHVPMYSECRTPRLAYNEQRIRDRAQLKEVVEDCSLNHACSWPTGWVRLIVKDESGKVDDLLQLAQKRLSSQGSIVIRKISSRMMREAASGELSGRDVGAASRLAGRWAMTACQLGLSGSKVFVNVYLRDEVVTLAERALPCASKGI